MEDNEGVSRRARGRRHRNDPLPDSDDSMHRHSNHREENSFRNQQPTTSNVGSDRALARTSVGGHISESGNESETVMKIALEQHDKGPHSLPGKSIGVVC